MRTATIHEIKKELEHKNNKELIAFCTRLSKFKKENKELITFLLFEEDNIANYIENIKRDMILLFEAISPTHIYYVKKSVRKILRLVNKHIRITGSKAAEAELLIQFCNSLKALPGSSFRHKQINKIYETQIGKIELAISSLHPDLQYDLRKKL